MKVILLNGPIGSGKDTIGAALFRALVQRGCRVRMASFKAAIWEVLGRHFGLTTEQVKHLQCAHDNRVLKERPQALLYGRSTREALIYISEEVVKPNCGVDYFGRQVADYLQVDERYNDPFDFAIITDSGFIEELQPVAHRYSSYVFRLMGRGTFEGDSRRYLEWAECVEAGVLAMKDIHLEEGHPEYAVDEILLSIN
ncbi:deoxynucleoside monophosphate kinase [Pectobacterium phage Arno160]|uniref:Deoxynucleoside monophosphate kinase n=1 Tax=Pectobacterium phage Arno160 TaxID=2488835 RepID=A0A3G8F1V8_9CAUD|nr:deoxynucleoside monophosphate kinase [Pectobacterium phage Arno160]AZF88091.1 deoxynucleoside monophosphate kinase [Pectobacterium phage Arno160]